MNEWMLSFEDVTYEEKMLLIKAKIDMRWMNEF